MPLYNLIHADDILAAKNHLIYLNKIYEDTYNSLINLDFTNSLYQYLGAFINYYDLITNVDRVIVKRSYHILRVKAILDNYKKNKKYELNLSKEWINKIELHKNNWNEQGPEYLEVLSGYLKEINEVRESLKIKEPTDEA